MPLLQSICYVCSYLYIRLVRLSFVLDASTALTLRRELVEAIEQKFPMLPNDDFVWPSLSDHDEDSYIITSVEDDDGRNTILKMYWNTIRTGYVCDHDLDTPNGSRTDTLPHNWTVVNISVADDKNAIFVSRQRADAQPLIFCIPIDRQGRKEEKDDAHFTFKEGIGQLKEILNASDHIAKAAKDVASGDRNGKVAWWAKRTALDRQLQDLLDNIEFCWLGAFKVTRRPSMYIFANCILFRPFYTSREEFPKTN